MPTGAPRQHAAPTRRSLRDSATPRDPITAPPLTRRAARISMAAGEPIAATSAAPSATSGLTAPTASSGGLPQSEPGLPPITRSAEPSRSPARIRRTTLRAAGFSVGVMGIVGLLTVGMTTSAEALPHEHQLPIAGDVVDYDSTDVQSYVAAADSGNPGFSRTETYSVESLVNLASAAGVSNYSNAVFTNDPNCAIQWPYPVGVPITFGFGMRSGRMHEGTDFVPGSGAQIQAIADGVVRASTDSGGAYGVTIIIDHVINGEQVSTRYAHMEYNSRQVQVGDTVRVGEYIGRTGNTGRSFGAHSHFEVLVNGTTAIDPLPWLRSHAVC